MIIFFSANLVGIPFRFVLEGSAFNDGNDTHSVKIIAAKIFDFWQFIIGWEKIVTDMPSLRCHRLKSKALIHDDECLRFFVFGL